MIKHAKFSSNLLSNFSGAAVSALVPIISIPFYINTLGPTHWGLVSFVILMQAILSIVEAGLAQVLVREFQNFMKDDLLKRSSKLLHEFEVVYILFSTIVLVSILLFSKNIAISWILVKNSDIPLASDVILLSGFLIAFQLPGSLYRSALLSLGSHLPVNIISSVAITLKHIVGVYIALKWGSVVLLVAWFAFNGLLETLAKRFFSRMTFKYNYSELDFNFTEIRSILRFAGKMIIATLIGVLAVQSDKIAVSNMLSIEQFAYFSLASTLSMGFLQFVYPINTSSLPILIAAQGHRKEIWHCNMKIIKSIALIFVPAWIIVLIYGENLINFWLKNTLVSAEVFPLFIFLFFGTTLNAVYGVGLNNLLAQGRAGHIAKVNFIALILTFISLPLFINNFGLIGASSGWIVFNLVSLICVFVIFIRSSNNI